MDEAIRQYQESIHLKPDYAMAHNNLGAALVGKGDWDGAIAEFHEALRLNPNLANAHYGLGLSLEVKGDRRGALEEFRSAYELDSENSSFRESYERLLK